MTNKTQNKKIKYNIIGDIHGRTVWKDLIIADGVNIFVGDYFSPYDKTCTFDKCMCNFKEIIEFKKQRPETILLIGNHDIDHWKLLHKDAQISRHDYEHEKEIYEAFEQNKDLFCAAYSINNKYLVTHAGVSILWYYYMLMEKTLNIKLPTRPSFLLNLSKYNCETASDAWKMHDDTITSESFMPKRNLKPQDGLMIFFKNKWYIVNNGTFSKISNLTPDIIAENINHIFDNYPEEFAFLKNARYNDYCGNSITQSPFWIRPDELEVSNVFKGSKKYKQIVGHTKFDDITHIYENNASKQKGNGNLIFTDCLEYTTNSFSFVD